MAEPSRRRRPGTRARPVFLAALALAACGEGEGPVGAPGGRDGVQLRYVAPRLQVVPVGEAARVTLSFRVRRVEGDGEPEPWAGATFEVRREKGTARVPVDRVATDADGIATVVLMTSGAVDRTTIEFVLEGDRRQHLPFDVVTAPTRELELAPGTVEDIDPTKTGVLLRLRVEPGERVALVPYQLDPRRGGVAYRFLHQGAGLDPGAVAFGADPPAVPGTRPQVVTRDRGHVVAGAIEPGPLEPAAAIPRAVNVNSCKVNAFREAPLRYLGESVALYVDAPPDQWQARIDSIGRAFDERIMPTNTELFGPTTDMDGNGVVLVVLTPELQGFGGVYCDSLRTIGVEIFYALWTEREPLGTVLSSLAHEHQHLINAGHHLRTRGGIGDERWLNEGLSFAAEGLNGYWRNSLGRVWHFLSGQNGGRSMLPFEYDLAYADKYQMFVLYLGDRFGRGVYHRLGTSGRLGASNVQHVTGLPFDSLVRDWMVASAVSGRVGFDDPRYRYSTVDLGGMAEEIAACGCLPKPRLQGMSLETLSLGASFDVFRAMEGYDADYYALVPAEGDRDRTYEIYFDAFGRPAVRLAAARLP